MGSYAIIKNDDVESQTSWAEIPFLFAHHVRCQSIQSFPNPAPHLSTLFSPLLLINVPDYKINNWSILATMKFEFKLLFSSSHTPRLKH